MTDTVYLILGFAPWVLMVMYCVVSPVLMLADRDKGIWGYLVTCFMARCSFALLTVHIVLTACGERGK